MAHLSGFGLENFRVFKDYTWFDFAPITILVGPNNSGKSSLIKALLLLKDNLDKGNLPIDYEHIDTYQDEEHYDEDYKPVPLKFNTSIHGLNSPVAVKSKQSANDDLSFSIPYILHRPRPLPPARGLVISDKLAYYRLAFHIDQDSDNANPMHRVEVYGTNYNTIIKMTDKSIYFDPVEYDNVVYHDHQKMSSKIDPLLKYQKAIDFHGWVNLKSWFLANNIEDEKATDLSEEILFYLGLSELSENKKAIGSALSIIKGIDYWSTSRNEQKRVFTDDDKSNTKSLLEDYQNAKSVYNTDYFMKRYTELFELPGLVQSNYEPEKGIHFPNISNVSLINFGFGYTQIATLLFKIAAHLAGNADSQYGFSEESILILEEPEVNLHPSFQSKLGDLFAGSIEGDNIQFIIETHSEYLIRKLQFLVASPKSTLKPEDVVIYYFNDPDETKRPMGEKQVKKITILDDGSLSDDFGPGFYDEAANWELELLKLKRNKNRQN